MCGGNNNRNYVSEGLGGTNGTGQSLSILPGGQCQIITTLFLFFIIFVCSIHVGGCTDLCLHVLGPKEDIGCLSLLLSAFISLRQGLSPKQVRHCWARLVASKCQQSSSWFLPAQEPQAREATWFFTWELGPEL